MSIEIYLSGGRVAFLDDEDGDLVSMRWHACPRRGGICYVRRRVKQDGRSQSIMLHRVVAERMGISGPPDHINRNGLDNRRSNLRPGTHNQANRRLQRTNTTGYRGVIYDRNTKGKNKYRKRRWRAEIRIGRKLKHLGSFFDPVSAAKAYDAAALEAFGEYASPNFPGGTGTPSTPRGSR